MSSRLFVGLSFALGLLISSGGCSKSDSTGVTAQVEGAPSVDGTALSTTTTPGAKAASRPKPPTGDPLHPIVEVQTSAGKIMLELDAENAPGTVRNFLNYVNSEAYNSTVIHYVDSGSMILGGGFNAELAPIEVSPPIRNEAHNGLKNVAGTIAMSRPFDFIDGATSQFFINVRDNATLDHTGPGEEEYGYCVFGKVTSGLEVIEQIAQTPVHTEGDFTNTPKQRVVVQSVRFVK
jgi:peptidyl-prolyl cis-trans isomerase A (cyclophilin A)